MSEFCKSLKLGRFKKKKLRGYVQEAIQPMLVHKKASNCSKMPMRKIRRFYDIIK